MASLNDANSKQEGEANTEIQLAGTRQQRAERQEIQTIKNVTTPVWQSAGSGSLADSVSVIRQPHVDE